MPLVRHKIKRYDWVADTPDQRDHRYAAPVAHLRKLPPKVDLRAKCPKIVYNQGQLGSCTGNAIACAIQFDRLKQKLKPDVIPARLFIYYNECNMEDIISAAFISRPIVVREGKVNSFCVALKNISDCKFVGI